MNEGSCDDTRCRCSQASMVRLCVEPKDDTVLITRSSNHVSGYLKDSKSQLRILFGCEMNNCGKHGPRPQDVLQALHTQQTRKEATAETSNNCDCTEPSRRLLTNSDNIRISLFVESERRTTNRRARCWADICSIALNFAAHSESIADLNSMF